MTKYTPHFERRHLWRERLIAIIALINLVLVFFDISYIYARDFYWQFIPEITRLYDPVKGIKPHPETVNYLTQVEDLQAQVIATGLPSSQVENQLSQLRQLSLQMIEDNPFAVTDQSNILEKIKDELRQRTGENSGRDAFTTFWSQNHLQSRGWQQEINFWNTQIQPLIAINYYRDINKFGKFVDWFWLIDLPFIIIFALDLLVRISLIKRHHPKLSWLKALLRRWYDIFLLLPFWRSLRVIPVLIRLYQTELLDLAPLQAEAQRDFVIGFASQLTEMVGIQVIDQMQSAIKRGDVTTWLLHPESRQPYVQINNTNEVAALTKRVVNVSVYDVLPKVQPDIEDLLHHSITTTLNQLPVWQQLQYFPALQQLPAQLTENLSKFISQTAYKNLVNAIEDPIAAEITERLSRNFRDALEAELQKKHNMQEIQSLLIDLLEEIKINYVRGVEEFGIEQLIDEAEQLQYKIKSYSQISSNSLVKKGQ
ncbi:hypothetical protein [Anabaena subtropica]|uniref:Uridine phosphorylase n=1 Tax=Anabaena subtropica FACHB-260 TaxID=2692884 RepID=A0ABR8CSU1_9NOST|nr:hypothetical protein [Anabaena subtropica]MBD2346039.1 hypothetical protein [Anabaena subtropica FACHB-260]